MAGTVKNEKYQCMPCRTQPLEAYLYISHIQSKRHLKNLKDKTRPQPNDAHKRTVLITALGTKNVPLEGVVRMFLQYGVRLATRTGKADTFTIEFHSEEGAKSAIESKHQWKDNVLKVTPINHNKSNADSKSVPIRHFMWRRLTGKPRGNALNRLIYDLITEIEIKPQEYKKRDYLCYVMERFLTPHFHQSQVFIFGSSANNLGFTGCDVDIYANLGVDPWHSSYTRAQAQSNASDLTYYLTRQIRSNRLGSQIQAVPRARVPIVKFKEHSTGLHVDLSFRHSMPVYNTKLIHQYTFTHELVRPYMMLIRCWAKIQNVAGGGEPSFLITNYALCMMMLFYLMVRDDPIVPPVTYLRQNARPFVVAEWDCSFGNDISEWKNKSHQVTIMELVTEFFEFYSNLETSKWVVSPHAGSLIEQSDIKDRDMRKLPRCMWPYCQQDTDLQINTALCVQDPFELSHNCTRGLKQGPLAEFQYKCKVAAQISQGVSQGTYSLADFLEMVEISPATLEEMSVLDDTDDDPVIVEENGNKEKLPDVITLDDSQDSIIELDPEEVESDQKVKAEEESQSKSEYLRKALKVKEDSQNKENDLRDDITIQEDSESTCMASHSAVITRTNKNETDDEILNKRKMSAKSSTESSSDVEILLDTTLDITDVKGGNTNSEATNEASGSQESESVTYYEYCNNMPGTFPLIRVINFGNIPEFTINFDGAVSGGKGVITQEDDIGRAACSLISFTLQQILKVEVSVIEDFLGNKKRKAQEMEDDRDSSKRLKAENGECIAVPVRYRKLAKYKCTTNVYLWVGRKKISKTVPKKFNDSPLQHELHISEIQMESQDESGNGVSCECLIEIWQSCDKANRIYMTMKELPDRASKGHCVNMYSYAVSAIQGLIKKIATHVINTSSKR